MDNTIVSQQENKTPNRNPMRNKIILLVSVVAVAVILLGVYFIFFRTSDSEQGDYYVISPAALALSELDFDKVTISFASDRDSLDGNNQLTYVSGFAESFEHKVGGIKVEFSSGSDFCAVSCGDNRVVLSEAEFFNTLENGTRYSFNGEVLLAMAILEVTGNAEGRSSDEFTVYALPGYDIDGDTVGTNNRPFIYHNISRSDVNRFTVTNSYGTYSAYRLNNVFVFENAELCSYDQEKFASMVVNCTYMLAIGKLSNVPEDEFAKYGVESEDSASCVVDVETTKGVHHRIIIGDKLASGGGYYARYIGKPHVYILDNAVEKELLQPVTVMLTPSLGYSISNTYDTYDISDVLLMYNSEDLSIYIQRRIDLVLSSNITPFSSSQEVGTVLHDKVYHSGAYAGGWTENKNLVGIKSSSGSLAYIDFNLERYSADGNYSVTFGLVKDTAAGAHLPTALTVQLYDSEQKQYVDVVTFTDFEQSEKSYKQYTVDFKAAERVRTVRLCFNLPTGNSYAVFDEITVNCDGWDAIPKETVSGVWKIVSPESYIKEGYNFSMPDPSTFSEILYGMATLVGDSVVDYNIYGESDKLAKYGLDNPDMALYYNFKGYKSYIYLSKPDSENSRYAYSVIEFTDENGKENQISTGIIAKVTQKTAPWMSWQPLEFLDRSTFTMYIDKIDTIEMEFDGETYLFELKKGSDGKLAAVVCNGKEVDLQNFRYLYMSVLSCTRAGEYTPAEGDTRTPYFRFKMTSPVKNTEIIYYRVTSTKLVYETDGVPSNYYVLFADVNTIINNVKLLLDGKDVPR